MHSISTKTTICSFRFVVSVLMLAASLSANAFWPPLRNVWSVLEQTNSTEWRISFGVYDPVRQSTSQIDTGWFQAWSVSLKATNGVVAWSKQPAADSPRTLYFNVYDPGVGAWQTTNITFYLPLGYHYVADGVTAWMEGNGGSAVYSGAATYDPALRQWAINRASAVAGNLIFSTEKSAVAFLEGGSSAYYLRCWMYDPLLHSWRAQRYGPYNAMFAAFSFDNSTILLHVGTTVYQMGYDYRTGSWGSYATYPLTAFHASTNTGTAPLAVWFTDLSLAATSWGWSFDDGTGSGERSPCHIFSDAGTYNVVLTARGNSTNSLIVVTAAPRLIFTGLTGNYCQLQLISETNTVHVLESSTNLQSWDSVRSLTNLTGVLDFEEAIQPEMGLRFFRTRQVAQ
jgi:hypothetical protein